MISKNQLIDLGFKVKNENKITETTDYSHTDYPFMINLNDHYAQVIHPINSKEKEITFGKIEELIEWLNSID